MRFSLEVARTALTLGPAVAQKFDKNSIGGRFNVMAEAEILATHRADNKLSGMKREAGLRGIRAVFATTAKDKNCRRGMHWSLSKANQHKCAKFGEPFAVFQ